jgi:hypothetical protein
MANRIWQHLVGIGLVATPDNFGRMGELPTHPELLDHLAIRFMEQGWSVKQLVRYIVTSRSWQMASESSPEARQRDPQNKLLSHARVRRLEAESVRDAMLAVSGVLKPGHEGPGIRLYYQTQIDPDKQPAPGPIDGDGRRSIYLEVRRNFLSDFLVGFDFPKPNLPIGKRSETNVPAQSLAMLNDPLVRHLAHRWADRIVASSADDSERIERMYLEAFARRPNDAEWQAAREFLSPPGVLDSESAKSSERWRDFAHALFNMKEFIFLQ